MLGLTSQEAKEALAKYGYNILPRTEGSTFFKVFLNQFKNAFSLILIIATFLSVVAGDVIDGILIGAILILNVILGFWQEYKASKELAALRSFEVLYSRVLRDGVETEIPSQEIVPGDVVILESGDKIPADGKIIESYSLQINESILTGESLSVMKLKKEGENLLYFGTNVVSGRGKFEVTGTGLKTRFGSIAEILQEVEDEKTPLELSLSKLIRWVGLVAVVVAVIIFILRISQGFELSESFLVSIALLVAAVPEGLPAVVTIILALGVRKMYKQKALVRKMIGVESLGAATVILSDKTGTLTKNEMRVQEVKSVLKDESELLKCAVLCNSASLVLSEGSTDILGDTTEGALLLWAKDLGHDIDLIRNEGKLVEEIPFSLQTRKMTIVWEHSSKKVSYTKGAPEIIFQEVKLSEKEKINWDIEYQKLASKGLRVLGFCKNEHSSSANKQFLGLIGIADQIRDEVKDAIKKCRQAGIKVVMVTGDNELTAKAVADQLGLMSESDEVLTGKQLEELDDSALLSRIGQVRVFARITPENKYRLVKAYQTLGEVVAVTGDGVNDSLALKQAQVGVSMGKMGTDVAKEASDIILLDDNFATLVLAVEQGRLIYNNILKVIKFLMTGNLAEILVIVGASLLALPAPLAATQILWINFISDGLPALALGFDDASKNIMDTPPRRGSNILDKSMISYILIGGFTIFGICLLGFWYTLENYGLQNARAVVFTLMVVLQMVLPFIIRRHHSIVSNKKLLISVVLILISQVLILTVPQLRTLFGIN